MIKAENMELLFLTSLRVKKKWVRQQLKPRTIGVTFPTWKLQHAFLVWRHGGVAVNTITCVQFPQ